MSDILNLGLHAASGGLFGLLGTGLGRIAGYFERKQSHKHELALLEFKAKQNSHDLLVQEREHAHDEKLARLNIEMAAAETENEILLMAQKGSWDGLERSLQHDAAMGLGSQWVVNLLRLVRPSLTFLLWIITAIIFMKTQNQDIAEAAVFAATAATLWWFGDRAPNMMRGKGPSHV